MTKPNSESCIMINDWMSCGCSRKSPEEIKSYQISRSIDQKLKLDERKFQRQVKLLLLGAGESGKSTFLKQMKIIHGVKFENEQLNEYKKLIFQNIIRGMRVLIDANRKLNIPLHNYNNKIYGDNLLAFDRFAALDSQLMLEFGPMVTSLWADPGIQTTYKRRSEYQLTDSVAYFFNNIHRVCNRHYEPTHQDILYSRRTTRGVEEFLVNIENIPFLFVDVGGQRTQRQKWFQCFDDVSSVIFIASASEFDQVLLEDRKMNRLQESRNIFDTIVNNRIFADISCILFLNKMDLLYDKVIRDRVDISQYFEEFGNFEEIQKFAEKYSFRAFGGDPTDLIDVKAFILYLFITKHRQSPSMKKTLYHHFTTAVDTRNIEYVFASVKEAILIKNLGTLLLQ